MTADIGHHVSHMPMSCRKNTLLALFALFAAVLACPAVENAPSPLDDKSQGSSALAQARDFENKGDFAKAQRLYGRIIRDSSLLRTVPTAVEEAYNRLHALMISQGKNSASRAVLVDDAKRKVRQQEILSAILEREGLVRLREKDYAGAAASLSSAKSLSTTAQAIHSILIKSTANASEAVSDEDLGFLAEIAKGRQDCLLPICALLSRKRDGWRAEDFLARDRLERGESKEAFSIWDDMRRTRRGPREFLDVCCAKAQMAYDRKRGIASIRKWLSENRKSAYREQMSLLYGIGLLDSGEYHSASNALAQFSQAYPDSRFSNQVAMAVARLEKNMAAVDAAEKARRDAAELRRNDATAADIAEGRELLASGRFQEARRLFEKAVKSRNHPEWGTAAYFLGKARLELGDHQGAVSIWTEAWKRNKFGGCISFAAESRLAMGRFCLEEGGKPELALQYLDEAISLKPELKSESSDLVQALALGAIGRIDEACAIFDALANKCEAGDDPAKALRWRNLAKMARNGDLAQPKNPDAVARRNAADLTLADGFAAGGENKKAMKLYLRVLSKSGESADRAAFGAAKCAERLGHAKDALALYGKFLKEFSKSPLAPQALLFAGTLSASPNVRNEKKAKEWFANCSRLFPKSQEAMAADFYNATLAWHGGKWQEAERLHREFLEKYPGTALADHVAESRLPNIAARKSSGNGAMVSYYSVTVGPYDRKRIPISIPGPSSRDARLTVSPQAGYKLGNSSIAALEGHLWTGPDKIGNDHVYHLSNAYSSQEYAQVFGELIPPEGDEGVPPYFHVTVPSVDIDWTLYSRSADENGEDTRILLQPLSDNFANWQTAIIARPYDDFSAVPPVLQLSWSPPDAATLVNAFSLVPFVNGNRINVKEYESSGETWPLYIRVRPEQMCPDLTITLEGQSGDGPYGKSVDKIHCAIVKARLTGFAAWRGAEDKQVPDEEKYTPGFLVTKASQGHRSAKLKFGGIPDVPLTRYYKFSKAGLVLANGRATTAEEVVIRGNDDYEMTVSMTDPSNWGNDSYVDVEYILKDSRGNVFDKDQCRLLRPYVVAVGDSLTYGVMRYDTREKITPVWLWDAKPYPSASDWLSIPIPPNAIPPYNIAPDRTSPLYQGYRGYLSQSLPGFTWLGFDTNGHGPRHCGLPGAKIHETFTHATFQSTLANQNSFLIVIMMAGANDSIKFSDAGAIQMQWENDANSISSLRMNGGRTLLLALKVPQISSRCHGRNYGTITTNITQLNGKISTWSAPANHRFVISSIVETGGIPHDDNDDGLHFLSTGYETMAQIIFNALKEGLKLCDSAKAGN